MIHQHEVDQIHPDRCRLENRVCYVDALVDRDRHSDAKTQRHAHRKRDAHKQM